MARVAKGRDTGNRAGIWRPRARGPQLLPAFDQAVHGLPARGISSCVSVQPGPAGEIRVGDAPHPRLRVARQVGHVPHAADDATPTRTQLTSDGLTEERPTASGPRKPPTADRHPSSGSKKFGPALVREVSGRRRLRSHEAVTVILGSLRATQRAA